GAQGAGAALDRRSAIVLAGVAGAGQRRSVPSALQFEGGAGEIDVGRGGVDGAVRVRKRGAGGEAGAQAGHDGLLLVSPELDAFLRRLPPADRGELEGGVAPLRGRRDAQL